MKTLQELIAGVRIVKDDAADYAARKSDLLSRVDKIDECDLDAAYREGHRAACDALVPLIEAMYSVAEKFDCASYMEDEIRSLLTQKEGEK